MTSHCLQKQFWVDEIKRKAGEGHSKPTELMGAGERGVGMHKTQAFLEVRKQVPQKWS